VGSVGMQANCKGSCRFYLEAALGMQCTERSLIRRSQTAVKVTNRLEHTLSSLLKVAFCAKGLA